MNKLYWLYFRKANNFGAFMKNRVTLWGQDSKDNTIFLAMQLRVEQNEVDIFVFPLALANNAFQEAMKKSWCESDGEVAFPDGHQHIIRKMSQENLLPEDIRVTNTEFIHRVEHEWGIKVLSFRLVQLLTDAILDIEKKAAEMELFDQSLWDAATEQWDKIKEHSSERNIDKASAELLRNRLNKVFEKLKDYRTKFNKQFEEEAARVFQTFKENLDAKAKELEGRYQFGKMMEDLKQFREDLKEAKLLKNQKNELWESVNGLFEKLISQKKEFDSQRFQGRIDGLLDAIGKMEKSINRDQSDIEFNRKKVGHSDTKLENQLREAKIKMLEDAVESKNLKLKDMKQTLAQLQKRVGSKPPKK